jgi:hypothetical protein
MTIHNAADYGYTTEPSDRSVRIGDTIRFECALGLYEVRVVRRHRDIGYFETTFDRWISEVPAFRQGFVGSIEVRSRTDLLAAKYAA